MITSMLNKTLTQDTERAVEFFDAKNAFTTGPVEVSYMIHEKRSEIQVIDVRAREDYAKGHVPGAVNVPKEQWNAPNGHLKKDRVNIVYCYSQACHLAAKACAEFASRGYPVMEMEGGYQTWTEKGIPIEH